MPRTLSEEAQIRAEGLYKTSRMTAKEIAEHIGASEATIKNWAKRYGWKRDLVAAKREKVAAIMHGGGTGNVTSAMLDKEARQDAEDMNLALSNARKILFKVKQGAHHAEKSNELKTLADTNMKAADTIRKIRGLDGDTGGGSFDDELLALHHEITSDTTH